MSFAPSDLQSHTGQPAGDCQVNNRFSFQRCKTDRVAHGNQKSDTADLMGAWLTLSAAHAASARAVAIGQALLESWEEPHRRYHNAFHLRDVLLRVDSLAAHAADPDAVRFAAFYHDAVYQGRPDDEENSARRAAEELAEMGLPEDLINEVSRLVRLTASHDPVVGDSNGETLSDADLAILSAPPDRYATYVASVRAEYAHLDDSTFREGRSKVLRALLEAPALYRTAVAREHWEAKARANLRAELQSY
jgi:predicted metal-dependent HD superfamily phosphohydrolase